MVVSLDDAPFVRHPLHYYEDGNIVLVVQNTVFRVYRGVLTHQSEVMRDLFSIAHPTESTGDLPGTHGGAPVIRLVEDDALDFSQTLDRLFPQYSADAPPTDRVPTFDNLAAVGRIARKYIMVDLEKWVIKHLTLQFPHTLAHIRAEPTLKALMNPKVAAQLIVLSRLLECDQLLPLAFFSLQTSFVNKNSQLYREALLLLSHRDLARLMQGTIALQEVYAEASRKKQNQLNRFSKTSGCTCLDKNASSAVYASLVTGATFSGLQPAALRRRAKKKDLCEACLTDVGLVSIGFDETIFATLPKAFDLPSNTVLPACATSNVDTYFLMFGS